MSVITLPFDGIDVSIPDKLQEVLDGIHILKRPRCFDLEDEIAELTSGKAPSSQAKAAALHVAIARAIFGRVMSCDVMYTYNVVNEATQALSKAEAAHATDVAFEAHCLLSRAYCFHQVGNALDNLRSAREHLDAAHKLRPDLASGPGWAEALLDLARKTQLVSPDDPSWRLLYEQILECVREAEAQGLHQAAHEHISGAAVQRSALKHGSIATAEAALANAGEGMLTRELALLADGLGERYIERGRSGDRERALRCFQAAERSFYYLKVDPKDQARNQLHLAGWLVAAEIADADDFDYVLTKALNAVSVAAALTPPERYSDEHAASYLVAAEVYDAAGQNEQAVACLREGLQFALPGGRSWRNLRTRLAEHNQSVF